MSEPIHIDGAYGEGGGQILRTSASLAAITGRAIRIEQIRAKRTKPGLQPQHLMAVRAAAEICGAKLVGAEVGSQTLEMRPQRPVRAGDYRFDIGTAGATTLVVQAVLVPLLLTGTASRLTVTGGTHNDHAPCAEYLEFVLLPALATLGVQSSFQYDCAGFYPRGGGMIEVALAAPTGLTAHEFPGYRRERSRGVVVTAQLPPPVGERGQKVLREVCDRVELRDLPSPGPGAAAFAYLEGIAGFTGLGRRGKPMEEVAKDSVDPMREFLRTSGKIDEHLADQLVLPLAMAKGPSRFHTWQVTEHLRTVVWVVRQFLAAEIRLTEHADGSGTVEISPS